MAKTPEHRRPKPGEIWRLATQFGYGSFKPGRYMIVCVYRDKQTLGGCAVRLTNIDPNIKLLNATLNIALVEILAFFLPPRAKKLQYTCR